MLRCRSASTFSATYIISTGRNSRFVYRKVFVFAISLFLSEYLSISDNKVFVCWNKFKRVLFKHCRLSLVVNTCVNEANACAFYLPAVRTLTVYLLSHFSN